MHSLMHWSCHGGRQWRPLHAWLRHWSDLVEWGWLLRERVPWYIINASPRQAVQDVPHSNKAQCECTPSAARV
ncbi:hypothetical protein IG631_06248 [Alternaria alternata]|nr:hypothetical protein IG631_06248 [Alternaria alternata]